MRNCTDFMKGSTLTTRGSVTMFHHRQSILTMAESQQQAISNFEAVRPCFTVLMHEMYFN